eukprot:GHVT01101320.1.p3 GENE.GHVT01101320.1~~GHVT01101320.1.p3  ORF type:complete len:156 (-),score=31.57 GHVT01101320.1:423-890(-)
MAPMGPRVWLDGPSIRPKCGRGAGGSQLQFMRLMAANKVMNPNVTATSFTYEEVAAHASCGDCWVVLKNAVYNITPYLDFHPGGRQLLLDVAGRDCTQEFTQYHPWVNADSLLHKLKLGTVKPKTRTGLGADTSGASRKDANFPPAPQGDDSSMP